MILRSPYRIQRLSKQLAKFGPTYLANKLKNPYIIFGNNRSGKSFLASLLANHKDIAVYPDEALELWHPQTYPWLSSRHKDHLPPYGFDPIKYSKLSLKYRNPSDLNYIQAVFSVYRIVMTKQVFLNESSMITFIIPFLLKNIKDIKLIHIVRDGRAMSFESAVNAHKQIKESINIYKRFGYDVTFEELLRILARSWKLSIEEVERQKRNLDLERKGILYELQYENLCNNPRTMLEQVADFMCLKWDRLLNIDYSQIVNRNSHYRKQLDPTLIREITRIMQPALTQWGY